MKMKTVRINGEEFKVEKNRTGVGSRNDYFLSKGYIVCMLIQLDSDKKLTIEEVNSRYKEETDLELEATEGDRGVWFDQFGDKLFIYADDTQGEFFTLEQLEELEDKDDDEE